MDKNPSKVYIILKSYKFYTILLCVKYLLKLSIIINFIRKLIKKYFKRDLQLKIGSNTTNCITCNCVNCDLSEYDVDDEEVRMINSSNTAKHTDLFQCSNNEINTVCIIFIK